MNVVQNHISLLDLDPAFRIADEDEASLLRQDVLDTLLEKEYEEGREDFLNLVETFMSTRDDVRLREIIFSLFDLSEQSVDPDEKLNEYLENYEAESREDLRALPWFRQYKADH